MVTIKRDSGYADLFRAYRIILDGKSVARIQNGQELKLQVPPGKHQIYLKLDWCRSNVLEFELGERDITFDCGSSLRDWRILLSLLYAAIFYREYMWIRQRMSIGAGPAPSGAAAGGPPVNLVK
jgi:hypothetical protein